MGDDRKGGRGVSGDARDMDARDAASEKDAIPEVEAEIVSDPSSPQGDLLKDDGPEAEASGETGASGRDGAGEEAGAKPRTPGVAIFAVFAVCALAVLAYWLWQSRDGGAVAAPAPSFAARDVEPGDAVNTLQGAADAQEPSSDRDPGLDDEPLDDAPASADAGMGDDLALSEDPLTDRFEGAVDGDDVIAAAPETESAALPDDADAIAQSDPQDDFADGGQAEAPEAPSSGLREQGDAVADAEAPSTEDAPVDDAVEADEPVESVVREANAEPATAEDQIGNAADDNAVAAAQAAFTQELDAVRNGFTREIERLTADLGAEREKNAALQAEMTAMRATFEETARARDASAEAALASLRAELATARRALEMPPEAAGEAAQALARLGAAIETGGAFETELDAVAAFTSDDDAYAALRARAAEGAPTRRELQARFSQAAREALAAASQDEAEGMIGNLEARLLNIISIRPAAPEPGDSPRAVMSRIEDAVRRDAYALALSQIDALPQPAQAALEGWAGDARIHEEIRTALTALNGAVLTQAAR